MMKTMSLQKLGNADIEGLVALSREAGWDYDEKELGTILSAGVITGHRNEMGKIISSAALLPYVKGAASIGMVIVSPEYRRLGLGEAVVKECMALAQNVPILLISTPEGRPLYEKLGFSEVRKIHKFLCDEYRPSRKASPYKIAVMKKDHLEEVYEADRLAFGTARRIFLSKRVEQSEKALVLKDMADRVVGFGLSIAGPENLILGPIVSFDQASAAALTHELAHSHNGTLRIDVPDGQQLFMDELIRCGFKKVSEPPVMIIHAKGMPERNGRLYGIAAQAFG